MPKARRSSVGAHPKGTCCAAQLCCANDAPRAPFTLVGAQLRCANGAQGTLFAQRSWAPTGMTLQRPAAAVGWRGSAVSPTTPSPPAPLAAAPEGATARNESDPARNGALFALEHLCRLAPERILYVSCNPATLVRDAEKLIQQGYQLSQCAMIDMFPHTGHLESISLFTKG